MSFPSAETGIRRDRRNYCPYANVGVENEFRAFAGDRAPFPLHHEDGPDRDLSIVIIKKIEKDEQFTFDSRAFNPVRQLFSRCRHAGADVSYGKQKYNKNCFSKNVTQTYAILDTVGRGHQPGGPGLRNVLAIVFQPLPVHQQAVRVHEQTVRFHFDGAPYVVHVENLVADQPKHPLRPPHYLRTRVVAKHENAVHGNRVKSHV